MSIDHHPHSRQWHWHLFYGRINFITDFYILMGEQKRSQNSSSLTNYNTATNRGTNKAEIETFYTIFKFKIIKRK